MKKFIYITIVAIIISTIGIQLYSAESERISNLHSYQNPKRNLSTPITGTESGQNTTYSDKHSPRPDYTIINKEDLHDIKCSMDIRLAGKVTEEQLREIANELKQSLRKSYQKIFIVYYLPDMQVGNGGWAISHFTPNLDIEILGFTAEQEATIIERQKKDKDKKNIGRWIDESPYTGRVMILYQKNNKTYLEEVFGDGSGKVEEMKVVETNGQKRYAPAEENIFGEYYSIDTKGNLCAYDDQGLILTAFKK